MYVKQVELAAAAFHSSDFPEERKPEIAFLGRSNVGKSSLINSLLGRKNLARTSSTPGKTRALFFYLVNRSMYFVDLPGYGYARVSKETRRSWAPLIEEYLAGRSVLCVCVHLVDIRHSPTADDRLMSNWLKQNGIPAVTVATKADKLSRSAQNRCLEIIRQELDLPAEAPLVLFSARTGQGRDRIWQQINRLAAAAGQKG